MRRAVALCLWVAFAGAARAEDRLPAFKENADKVGQQLLIVTPDYPRAALRDKRGGAVEIAGRVSPWGTLEDVRITPLAPADTEFVEPVREVIPYWLYYVPTDDACMPSSDPITNRVEFSAQDGKPHIEVTRLAAAPKKETPAMFRPRRNPTPNYPTRAVEMGFEGNVYARLEVNADGTIRGASAKGFSPRKSSVLRSMEAEVERTLMTWSYPPRDDGKADSWVGCYTFNFRIRDR